MKSRAKHWDNIFSKSQDTKLGWYEKDTSQTIKLLHEIPDWEKATIFIPGAGTSILIDDLLSRGVKLILNDISTEALRLVRQRVQDIHENIVWLCQDIAKPIKKTIPQIDIWIDRAVLHFLTKNEDIKRVLGKLKSALPLGVVCPIR